MEIQFDDILDEFMFEECLAHCYYDDPENPEFSKEMNKYIDELKDKYISRIKTFNNEKFEEIFNELFEDR